MKTNFFDRTFNVSFGELNHQSLNELLERKERLLREGRKIVDLSMINPSLPPDRKLLDRLVESSLKPFNHRYSVVRGVRKLREAFAAKYKQTFNVDLDPDKEICIVQGSKDGVHTLLSCVAKAGDVIAMPSPTYPAFSSSAKIAGLRVAHYRVGISESDTLESIQQVVKQTTPKILLLNFPHNPTGTSVSPEFYHNLSAICDDFSGLVVNDFVYGEMCFNDRPAPSLLSANELRERSLEIYSLSKAYSIPGWRIAALCGRREIISAISRFKSHMDFGVFLPLQIAAAHAICSDMDLAKGPRSYYNNGCSQVANTLLHLGWKLTSPKAGACVWAEAPSSIPYTGFNLTSRMLEEMGVLVMPGELFGNFPRHIRIAAVCTEEELREVISSYETWQSYAPI